MINNTLRIGNFTSSNIYKLMTNGKAKGTLSEKALTYISEKNIERKLNRSVENSGYSKDMAWGLFLEQRVHDLLGMEYQLTSNQTDQHPDINFWVGSKDLSVRGLKIGDIKCYQLLNFSYYTDCILSGDLELFKKEFPKEYWQLVSNAVINKVPKAEAVTYCPYYSELDEIREMALDYNDFDAWKYRFIYESNPEDLANLPDNGHYKNLNRFEFDVPLDDIELLKTRIETAGKLLIPFHKTVLNELTT